MSRLFAPWRHAWVTEGAGASGSAKCLFCTVWEETGQDREHLVVHRGDRALVMLNRYPYNGGHLMIVPREHVGSLAELPSASRAEVIELAALASTLAGELWSPHGFNMGLNQGSSGGAGIPDHLHFHVVPRWDGDTNFMTAVGETRVVSTDLEKIQEELSRAFLEASNPDHS